jgi:nitrogen-specific signal transduction histidine kinase
MEKIFHPNTTSKEYGSGIGLYMSSQIIKKHFGELQVKNQNNGAVFEILLQKS